MTINRLIHSPLKKVIKCLTLISIVLLFLYFHLFSQSTNDEKINSLIKKLTPAYKIEDSYKNLDIIGFDLLDENSNRLKSTKFKFFPRSSFYIVLYATRNIINKATLKENEMTNLIAVYHYENGGYFRSIETTYFIGEQATKSAPKEWQIGGIYKIQFAFNIPEFALPRVYSLELRNEKSVYAKETKNIIEAAKINISREHIRKKKRNGDYLLSLEGCLLNPAIQLNNEIYFPWTGNIEFYIDEDLKNFKKIIITAKGTQVSGIFPLLKTYVEEKEIGSVYVDSEWNKYMFNLKMDKESHVLKVRFDNNIPKRSMSIIKIKLVRGN